MKCGGCSNPQGTGHVVLAVYPALGRGPETLTWPVTHLLSLTARDLWTLKGGIWSILSKHSSVCVLGPQAVLRSWLSLVRSCSEPHQGLLSHESCTMPAVGDSLQVRPGGRQALFLGNAPPYMRLLYHWAILIFTQRLTVPHFCISIELQPIGARCL